jgi:Cu+-exporting ATPase
LTLTGSMELKSEHPIAQAIVSYGKDKEIRFENISEFESLTGSGLKGQVSGKEILIGNENLMKNYSISTNAFKTLIDEYSDIGKTLVFVAIKRELKGLLILEDEIKNNSKEVISKLKKMS